MKPVASSLVIDGQSHTSTVTLVAHVLRVKNGLFHDVALTMQSCHTMSPLKLGVVCVWGGGG